MNRRTAVTCRDMPGLFLPLKGKGWLDFHGFSLHEIGLLDHHATHHASVGAISSMDSLLNRPALKGGSIAPTRVFSWDGWAKHQHNPAMFGEIHIPLQGILLGVSAVIYAMRRSGSLWILASCWPCCWRGGQGDDGRRSKTVPFSHGASFCGQQPRHWRSISLMSQLCSNVQLQKG